MTPSTLKSSIILMQKELKKKIPYLNHGGCIWFAYYFEEALKSLNIPYKIYAYHHSPIGKTYDDFEGVGHIVTWIPGIGLVDGHEMWTNNPCEYCYRKEYKYKRKLHFKNIYRLATESRWNPTYDTYKYNSKLETIINTYIK